MRLLSKAFLSNNLFNRLVSIAVKKQWLDPRATLDCSAGSVGDIQENHRAAADGDDRDSSVSRCLVHPQSLLNPSFYFLPPHPSISLMTLTIRSAITRDIEFI